jgi:hypothetical protein
MILVILANAAIFACDSYPIDIKRLNYLETLNLGITGIFIVEILVRIIALGF